MGRGGTEQDRSGGFKSLEHVSDAFLEVYGTELNGAFENAARALTDTSVHLNFVEPFVEETIEMRGFDKLNLLYNWLEALLLKLYVEGKVYCVFDVKISGKNEDFVLLAKVKGEEFQVEKHRPKVEVKAVTYHLMEIYEKPGEVTLRFILDL